MKWSLSNISSIIKQAILCGALLVGGCFGQKQPDKITTSCFPFGMKTGLPTYEEEFEKLLKQKDPFKWKVIKIITDAETIEKAAFQLKAITGKPPVELTDYDLRGSVEIGGEPEKYYFNWDRKHLIYKSKAYKLGSDEYATLARLVEMCGK